MAAANPDFTGTSARMPVLFLGHGNPMNAIEDNEFSRAWIEIGESLPKPRAILCISAHWETRGVQVTAMEHPRTIHDFYGFPEELFRQRYPAPGSPDLARLVQETLPVPVELDQEWGLDHGTWSVLSRVFPRAEVPVVQLSLDASAPPQTHYEIGRALQPLRQRGVLIVGSGNIVHNLGMICWDGGVYPWAREFDETVRQRIESGDHASLVDDPHLGKEAALAIPTNEHYLPLLYALGALDKGDRLQFFAPRVALCSISMRCLLAGESNPG